jgi:CNT family concentrative nucleoside transporter
MISFEFSIVGATIILSLQAILGIFVFIAIAVACSEKRVIPHWRLVVVGLALQFIFALLVFNSSWTQSLLFTLNRGVSAIVAATETGAIFVFGYLGGDATRIDYPFEITNPNATVVLAFRVLPLILMFSVLSAMLWYLRILPAIVKGFAFALQRSLKVGGAVGVSAAANIFIGMVESPALIRPYLALLTRSELFVVMSCGMATIAGTVMVLYSVLLEGVIPNALGHILTASVISAPAAIMLAMIMVPERDTSTIERPELSVDYHSLMDAIARGTSEGLKLMANVAAMLLVLVALIALLNSALSLLPTVGAEPLSLERIFGWFFAPLTWLMGIPWQEAQTAGSLMGIKTALNELLGFFAMAELPPGTLSERSTVIMTYALCGFANFGSLGIMIAGLTGMCPQRALEIAQLAPRSLISGTLATCMTGAVAGLIS